MCMLPFVSKTIIRIKKFITNISEYNTLMMFVIVILLVMQMCRNSNTITYVVEPNVKKNGIVIDSNRVILKNIKKTLDSLVGKQ